ncbi:MAG: hypothetical protein P8K05_01540 [Dehalococcoidia bacterium]|jgi:hypothetical protein|nr:hypothetical protein [Dehalococcoidia bacterium]|tara:strand:+ start:3317 stop:3529 length:213 start_codon:yes stop_codon:yes gene_type:complete
MAIEKENLDNLSVIELSNLAEKISNEIMELYDKDESDETDDLIEEKTRYFNEVKSIIRDLHSDEPYPRGG